LIKQARRIVMIFVNPLNFKIIFYVLLKLNLLFFPLLIVLLLLYYLFFPLTEELLNELEMLFAIDMTIEKV